MLNQIIEKRPHAQRQMPALAHEHGMDFFNVARVEGAQHRHQTTGIDSRLHLESC